VYAILGNHDDDRDMPAALSRRGIIVLRDQVRTAFIRREPLDFAGIRFWTREQAKVANVLEDAHHPVILLAHDPRRLTEAAALGVSAVLSGHTHGGQVVLPGLGAPAARKFPVTEGLGTIGEATVFVSRGVGTVYLPVRINCPPEVAVITLRSA
jgi:predicted MPP superfamily phosphohydrolase